MIEINDWLEIVDYRINEGWQTEWKVFGPYTHTYEVTKQDYTGVYLFHLKCEFSVVTKTVFVIECHDYVKNVSFRWIHDAYRKHYEEEYKKREFYPEFAFSGQEFIEIETEKDILEKMTAIFNGVSYDDRVEVPLNLEEEELFELMKQAHERDLTLNQYVTTILEGFIANFDEKSHKV